MMLVPPKQRIPITPFDIKTQRDAFTVSLEGLKGVRPLCSVLPLLLCCASWPCRALKLITQLTLSTVESQCPRTGVCPSQRGPQKTGWFCVPDFSCSDIHYRPPTEGAQTSRQTPTGPIGKFHHTPTAYSGADSDLCRHLHLFQSTSTNLCSSTEWYTKTRISCCRVGRVNGSKTGIYCSQARINSTGVNGSQTRLCSSEARIH